jgi:hypothetical protein
LCCSPNKIVIINQRDARKKSQEEENILGKMVRHKMEG